MKRSDGSGTLLIERTVLQQRYERLSQAMPGTVADLLALKQQIPDGLTNTNRISDEVAAATEPLLGIENLVIARLDAVSFAIDAIRGE